MPANHFFCLLKVSIAVFIIAPFLFFTSAFAAPVVNTVSPVAGSTGVSVSSTARATFTEIIDGSTLSSCSFSVAAARKVMDVSAYNDRIIAATSDGTVLGWGSNTYGETVAPLGLSDVVRTATGSSHSLALKKSGTVVAWGDNSYGQTSVPAGLADVVAVDAGDNHSVALRSDGTVAAWGDNTYGQISTPVGLTGVKAIAASGRHSLALKANGTVVGWGYNYYGQISIPAGLTGVVAIAAGPNNSAAVKSDGTVVVWGMNYSNQNVVPAGLSGVTALAVGGSHVVALKSDGTVRAWGNNNSGQATVPAGLSGLAAITAGGTTSVALKTDGSIVVWGGSGASQNIIPETNDCVSSIVAGGYHSVALHSSGAFTPWGSNAYGQTVVPTGLAAVASVAVGEGVTVALRSDGTLASWGKNSTTPPVLFGVTAVAAGGFHAVALRGDGTVAAWGGNTYGESTVPAGLSGVMAVTAGFYHSLALKADGSLVAWGYNGYGQNTIPAALGNVTSIAAGMHHNLAIKSDGTVAAWGYNSKGQTSVPAGLAGVVQVAGGDEHSLALKSDGTVVAWGDNSKGQRTVPPGLVNVVAIAAGTKYSLALKSDGTLVGWGDNSYGQATFPRSPYQKVLGGDVSWDQQSFTATVTPVQPLPFGATIISRLTGAIKSESGQRLDPYTWSFDVATGYILSTAVSGNGTISCSPTTPSPGQDATCLLTPGTGSYLSGLTDNGMDVLSRVTAGSYTVAATASDHALSATFAPILESLTVSISGNGSGIVHSSPLPDISCSSGSCGTSYPKGSSAVLTTTPNFASSFVGWSGDCGGVGDCVIDLNASRSVRAKFSLTYGMIADSFSSGLLPSGWTVTDNADTGKVWVFNDPSHFGNNTGGSGLFAIADGNYNGYGFMDTELRSPAYDLSSYTSVTLSFKTDCSFTTGDEVADVDVSSGAAGPWTTVWRRIDNYRGPKTETVDISALAAGRPNVTVRFHYYNAYYNSYWGIDEVAVSGTQNMPVRLIGEGLTGYRGLQAAYDSAGSGDTLQALAVTFAEDLSLTRDISVILKGGFDTAFTGNSGGYSILTGTLKLSNGTVTVDGLRFR